ncbi:hypothetical protein GWR56_09600 [Mucilaginibacter sp. 14171R-50]|uniref:hypothetical protein n=1 Tax=Mucilaginibacter sp. 14171R-50 TaxID=2703789 RepID=UPI00138D6CD6|nr:hypothetical protein [Mucilaginibacter sp. 14171R-50]QHS55776.1 hypothetical protein GWR56_09600 [Mucilaginibacter sp. 14171R-50]
MKRLIYLLAVCVFVSCNNAPKKETRTINKAVNKIPAVTKDMIMGTWTNGSTENASFDIGRDSIYYVEYFKSFKYELNKNVITIHYPDSFNYTGKIRFVNDTMIMRSIEKTDAPSKFWKFKN